MKRRDLLKSAVPATAALLLIGTCVLCARWGLADLVAADASSRQAAMQEHAAKTGELADAPQANTLRDELMLAQRFDPRNPTTAEQLGGLYALNSNIGHYKHSNFAVVPEFGLNVGYDVTSHMRAFVGYNFLYWSSVARPGKQIDRTLDENRIPNFTINRTVATATETRPIGKVESESFWVQGINFGLLFKW